MLQCVIVNGKKSTYRAATSLISQDSVLVPLLFLMFTNDLLHKIVPLIRLFAYDTKIITRIKSLHDCTMLQHDLTELKKLGFYALTAPNAKC